MSSSDALARFQPDVHGGAAHEFRPCSPCDGEAATGGASEARPLSDFGGRSEAQRIREEVTAQVQAEAQEQLEQIQAQVDGRIQTLVAEIERSREEMLDELSVQATDLAFAVAERLVEETVKVDRSVIHRALQQAVESAAGERNLRLRVHPEDAESLREEKDLLAALHVSEVLADPRVQAGGCSLELGDRSWDATVEGRLEQLRESVREAMESTT